MTKPYTSKDKWIVSIIAGLIFALLASPYAFNLVNSLTSRFGIIVSDKAGYPTIMGLLLHSIIYILITRMLMR